MTISQLYRNRLIFSALCVVCAVFTAVLGYRYYDPGKAAASIMLLCVIPLFFLAAALTSYLMARESYRFDRGLTGPPEWRQLVGDARTWAENGYRTPEEVAAGVPPRKSPPEPRS